MVSHQGTAEGLISIVVPTRNRRALAEQCLLALVAAAVEDGNAEIIIVDQQSSDGLLEFLNRLHGLRVYPSLEKTVSGLRNEGVRHSCGKWIYFVDSDVLVARNQLALLRAVLAKEGASIVGCTYTLPDTPHWVERAWYQMSARKQDGEIAYINAGNLALAKSVFEEIGGFDPDFITGEDVELCTRARKAGVHVKQYRALGAAHLGNPKSLEDFLRKQLWHGTGATFGDRVALFSLGAIVSATLLLIVTAWQLSAGLQTSGALLLVGAFSAAFPLFAYLLRCRQQRTFLNPFTSVVLLYCYFLARCVAWVRARVR